MRSLSSVAITWKLMVPTQSSMPETILRGKAPTSKRSRSVMTSAMERNPRIMNASSAVAAFESFCLRRSSSWATLPFMLDAFAQAQQRAPLPDARPRDDDAGTFTLASVGDVIIRRPASALDDQGLQAAIALIRSADVAVGNMEGSLADLRHFEGPLSGFVGTHEAAADLKAMGFDMLNRANNHLLDSEAAGMFSTNDLLDKAGSSTLDRDVR